MIRRFLSLWLPRLSADRARILLRREGEASHSAAPLATYAKIRNAQLLVSVDPLAASLGLTVGLSLADARARRPNLIAAEADPIEESKLLGAIADWLQRFTPLVALDGADGIILDIAGVAHLFGGEEVLAREIESRLAGQGLSARAGIADFPRAAWALARFSKRRVAPIDVTEKDFAQLYHCLPIAALGLAESTVADMARAGLRQIGDVALRPRAPIAARFGEDAIARLDALSGLERGAISPRFAAPDFSAERRFASAIQERAAIEAALLRLAENLAVLLQRQAKGARWLEFALFRVDGAVRRIAVGASRPLNEPRAIARLFRERFETLDADELDAGYGFDVLRLSCLLAEPFAPIQGDFAQAPQEEKALAFADLLDRLSARLGARRVTRMDCVDTHMPEFAMMAIPATLGDERSSLSQRRSPSGLRASSLPRGTGEAGQARHNGEGAAYGGKNSPPLRPLRLFERPEPIEAIAEVPDGPPLRFKWRRALHEVAAIEGPERIAAEWWRRPGGLTRDYFRAEDAEGRRFWIYREGLYGRETARPKWYMHGLFG